MLFRRVEISCLLFKIFMRKRVYFNCVVSKMAYFWNSVSTKNLCCQAENSHWVHAFFTAKHGNFYCAKKGLSCTHPCHSKLLYFQFKTGKYYWVSGISGSIMLIFISIVVILSTFYCYKYLQENETVFSPKTARLYRSLLNLLVLDMLWSGVTSGFLTENRCSSRLSLCKFSFLLFS